MHGHRAETESTRPREPQEIDGVEAAALDAHWRAANYLSAGQIYLRDNVLLREPLTTDHLKPQLLGHWGTCPGLTLLYTHLDRLIRRSGRPTVSVWGPGHGAPAVRAGVWLEGTYGELEPQYRRDEEGMRALFRRFSTPGGVASHTSPEVPGSIQEGGELGYSLLHAYGVAFDNPEVLACAVIGDGESETGPLAASWRSNAFLDPVHDGAVLPVLHLNGYKIANPTLPARTEEQDLDDYLRGLGHEPLHVTADADSDPLRVHVELAHALDTAVARLDDVRRRSTDRSGTARPSRLRTPVLVLRTPKGWTGPKERDGEPVEGTWRAHQIPLPGVHEDPRQLRQLEEWLRSYRPDDLFDAVGRPRAEVLAPVPEGELRLGATPYANGGRLVSELPLPEAEAHAVPVEEPGSTGHQPTAVLGAYLGELLTRTAEQRDFRVFGPDEIDSNHLQGLYDTEEPGRTRGWQEGLLPTDRNLGRHGRVLEVLSEHMCQGWLEGYVQSGRHGFFASYEAFANIVGSMTAQYVKWLDQSGHVAWREPVASLNTLLTSHVWRQDHNGFSHQDPGYVDSLLNKSPDIVRAYLPPDTNTLLCTAEHVLRSRDTVNAVVAGKHDCPDWLDLPAAREHCRRGLGVWEWAGSERPGSAPDAVLACAGDVPTREALAAASILRAELPELAVRVVNVVDLARLLPHGEHPHGLTDEEFDGVFTRDRPVVFAYHGYPWLIHRLTYRRAYHDDLHVRGYKEAGATTTPFDMVVRNDMDRFRLVLDVLDRAEPRGSAAAGALRERMVAFRQRHREWVEEHAEDMPEVVDWQWRPDS